MKKCVIDIETESLDPKEGRIVCIGAKDVDSGRTEVFHNEDEKQMLEYFLKYYHEMQFGEIIGYNILFDFRFIFARCLKHGIKSNGFFKSVIIDLMHIMKSVRHIYSYNKAGTLDEWSNFLFESGKIQLPDNMKELYSQGRLSEIIEYNRKDVELTFRLWQRIQEVLA